MQVNSVSMLSNSSQMNSSKIDKNNFAKTNLMSKNHADSCSFEGKKIEKAGDVAGKIIGGILMAPLLLGGAIADAIDALKEKPSSDSYDGDIDDYYRGTSVDDPFYMP